MITRNVRLVGVLHRLVTVARERQRESQQASEREREREREQEKERERERKRERDLTKKQTSFLYRHTPQGK
ncbi:MAG: hypothetical protein GY782_11290 [Gammaproteobacteria bacterium]|nr:hypothetical protein [Gammaproteobacteria bacterium]